MGIFAWIAIGAMVGAIARLLLPNDEPEGIVARICIGIGGALVGAWIAARSIGPAGITRLSTSTLAGAAIGAILLTVSHFLITRLRQRHRPRAQVHGIDEYRRAA